LVLADEPTGNLDTTSSDEVLEVLDHLNQLGRTILLITHDQRVAQHAHRLIELVDGKVVSDEPIRPSRGRQTYGGRHRPETRPDNEAVPA
jgi:ABC-type lipoprotein export system ATPase subunit